MAIVGSNFIKMDIERSKPLKGKVNINNNIAITDVIESEMGLGSEQEKGMKFVFDYGCTYEPNVGHIKLIGEIFLIEKEELTNSILKSWKDNKEVPKEYMTNVLNAVLTKCNVQSLILSQTMNLPPPIPMPKVSIDQIKSEPKVQTAKDSKPEAKK